MNILVVIGARGGSKGVRNKNIRPLAGRPLIACTIGQALAWGRASKVVVSTDSNEIAAAAKEAGALVPFMRPAELATDTAPKLPVDRHAFLECERIFGERYDILVDLDATAPVRTMEDLDGCLEKFLAVKPDVLFSVVNAERNPYFNMVEEKPDGFVTLSKMLPGGVERRQDAPRVYSLNASIYFYGRDFILDESKTSIMTDRTAIYVMDDISSHDIDREIDFEFIEFLVEKGKVKL
ncbi:MAG: acylneuraminate cytidylyltransferase family protein [Thermodesulfovibrionales bacterium]|nr:acylneuraminate cytidylyltransferase family protein [Thermodesulfovibrionales bacterium]